MSDNQFVFSIIAVVIVGAIVGVAFYVGQRSGLKGAANVLAAVNGNSALLTSIEALGKSVPQDAVAVLLAALGIGESVTPNIELKDLLEQLKKLIAATTDGLPNDPPAPGTTTTTTTETVETTVIPGAVG